MSVVTHDHESETKNEVCEVVLFINEKTDIVESRGTALRFVGVVKDETRSSEN